MDKENLEIKGREIEKIFTTMGIGCILVNYFSNDFISKFEFNLRNLADFKKVNKAVEIMRACTHEAISQAESKSFHFAIEIKKEDCTLGLLNYKNQYDNNNKFSALLGIDRDNTPIFYDFKKAIHTLISGATGMGKTTILNNIIYALTNKNSASELEIYIIDIKKTLAIWDGLPHIKNTQIQDEYDAFNTLVKVSEIMEQRLNYLSQMKLTKAEDGMFSHIVVIIDELADLMLSDYKKYTEDEITHIAQLGRAVNISLIIATQNPIVKVCTSLIKANCPTRIALKTVSSTDSMNILGNKHAFELDGIGNAIIRSASDPTEYKFKACFLTDDEIKEYVNKEVENVSA